MPIMRLKRELDESDMEEREAERRVEVREEREAERRVEVREGISGHRLPPVVVKQEFSGLELKSQCDSSTSANISKTTDLELKKGFVISREPESAVVEVRPMSSVHSLSFDESRVSGSTGGGTGSSKPYPNPAMYSSKLYNSFAAVLNFSTCSGLWTVASPK